MEDHPLSAVHDSLFNIFTVTLHTGGCPLYPQPEDEPYYGDGEGSTYQFCLWFCMGAKLESLTSKEENRSMVYENRVLRRIFGPSRDEVTGWKKAL
jgi:hypothetical protein